MTPASPETVPPRRPWALWMALVPVAILLLRPVLIRHETAIKEWSPGCVFHRLTGLHCPGCGGTRAFFALTKGDVITAWRMNPMLVCGLFLGLVLVLLTVWDRWKGTGGRKRWWHLSERGVWMIAVGVLIFGVLRNLPLWPFTLLAPH